MKEELWDEDLGCIRIVRNARARSIIARKKDEEIHLTIPTGYSIAKVEKMLGEMKARLLALKSTKKILFDEQSNLQTISFSLNIVKNDVRNYYVNLTDNVLNIVCPRSCNFEEEEVQQKIRTYIESALRAEAKRIFPQKIELLAKQHGFVYTDLKINKSHTRWGSCSSKKSINLSINCMLLPQHLLDFVILHELCHTLEMNHGERFWALLDKVTNEQARQLTNELKTIKIGW